MASLVDFWKQMMVFFAVAGKQQGRCGWRWCLDMMVANIGPDDDKESRQHEGDPHSRVMAVIRKLRSKG